MKEQFLLSERHRPKKVVDCVLPKTTKDIFLGYLEKKDIPHFLFSGPPGIGKTTIAKALADELGCDILFINSADEGRSLDNLRSKVKTFASSVSLTGGRSKIVVYDEADALTIDVQRALRSIIEEHQKYTRFIFTCNNKGRIDEAIWSRCVNVDFSFNKQEHKEMMLQFVKRLQAILRIEGIEYEMEVLVKLIQRTFPDLRQTFNTIQKYSTNNKLDKSILLIDGVVNYDDLFKFLKERDFKNFRQWVSQNSSNDPSKVYSQMFKMLGEFVESASIPQAILILHDYMWKSSQVPDLELNMTSCCVELASNCKFK